MAAQGYATYLPNSFGPRGYVDVCPHTARVTPDEGVQVALLAAAALATRLQKTDRVIVMECRFALSTPRPVGAATRTTTSLSASTAGKLLAETKGRARREASARRPSVRATHRRGAQHRQRERRRIRVRESRAEVATWTAVADSLELPRAKP